MTVILTNLRNAVIAGFVLAAVVFLIYLTQAQFVSAVFWPFLVRWLHIMSGVMWIGLLWYFNFVQTPTMPKIPDELKGGVSRFIAPAALFWFRWAAMSTLIFGLLLAWNQSYLVQALSFGLVGEPLGPKPLFIGIGMWLAIIMWFNVWFVIWPNQQKALNIDNKFPDLAADAKAKAARTAMLFSRTNTFLSVPMLVAMTGAQTLG